MKRKYISLLIIIAIIIFSALVLMRPAPVTDEEITKCIGENSVLYTQLGCHACLNQESIFGDNYNKINVVDCYFEREVCAEKEIRATPTWIIDGKYYEGTRTIEQLKELTGC